MLFRLLLLSGCYVCHLLLCLAHCSNTHHVFMQIISASLILWVYNTIPEGAEQVLISFCPAIFSKNEYYGMFQQYFVLLLAYLKSLFSLIQIFWFELGC